MPVSMCLVVFFIVCVESQSGGLLPYEFVSFFLWRFYSELFEINFEGLY